MTRATGLVAAALLLDCCACTRPPQPIPQGPASLLLVTIDTLRADRVGCYGDASARTPRLDALGRAGRVYDAAFSVAPLTLPTHATLFTGLLPPEHGVRGNGGFALSAGPPTLAEVLRARGRRTAGFVGGFPLVRRFGLARGFDHYDDAVAKGGGVHYDYAERRGSEVVAAARGWLAGASGPVFVWVHLFDPHAPYDPPPAFRGPDAYRGEVAASDAALGELLSAWDARPGPSVVAVTSDHGEAFGEHGEESHSLFVYDTTLRVPLILRGGSVRPGRVAGAVGLADLPATLLAALGIDGVALPGRSFLESAGTAALYAETLAPRLDFGWSDLRAWRDGRHKYVKAPRPELYDVQADPGERTNLIERDPATARRMSAALEARLAQTPDGQSRTRVPDDVAERLRSLGYVQGPGGKGSGADPKDKAEVARVIARAVGPFPDHATAARTYAELVALDPENPLVAFRYADALLRSGHAERALPYYRQVIEGGPRTAEPFIGLATALAELRRLKDAGRTLEAALEVDAANGQVHYNLGEIARVRGDAAEARRRYQRALEDPVTQARARARLEALR